MGESFLNGRSFALIRYRATYVLLALTMLIVLLLNVPGQLRITTDSIDSYSLATGLPMVERYGHGWPLEYLARETSATGFGEPRTSSWHISQSVTSFRPWYLLGDVALSLMTLAMIAGLYEFRRKWRTASRQISLRALLVAIFVICAASSYYAAHQAQHSREAATIIRLSRARSAAGESDAVECVWTRGGPTWLRDLVGDPFFIAFDRVCFLCLVPTDNMREVTNFVRLRQVIIDQPVTDQEVNRLTNLRELEAIYLGINGVWKSSGEIPLPTLRVLALSRKRVINTESIRNLPALEILDLADVTLQGDLSKPLQSASKLRVLILRGSNIGDHDLKKAIAGSPRLQAIDLRNTTITDQSIAAIVKLPEVDFLYLEGTQLSSDGINRIHAALPTCDFGYSPLFDHDLTIEPTSENP